MNEIIFAEGDRNGARGGGLAGTFSYFFSIFWNPETSETSNSTQLSSLSACAFPCHIFISFYRGSEKREIERGEKRSVKARRREISSTFPLVTARLIGPICLPEFPNRRLLAVVHT